MTLPLRPREGKVPRYAHFQYLRIVELVGFRDYVLYVNKKIRL